MFFLVSVRSVHEGKTPVKDEMEVNREENETIVQKGKNLMLSDGSNYTREKPARWSYQGILIF